MLWEAFRWFVNVMEVIVVIAAILVTGLLAAVLPLWILGRLVGPSAGLGPGPEEMDSGAAGHVSPTCPQPKSESET